MATKNYKKKLDSNGQILIIFLGIMSVALGVGLAMNQRAVSVLHEGSTSVLSTRTYFAAEAGIEDALVNADISSCTIGSPCEADIDAECSYSYYAESPLSPEFILGKDKVLVFNTEGASGSTRFYWNKPAKDDCSDANANALEIIQIYESGGSLTSSKVSYACCFSSGSPDGFISSSGSGTGDYQYYGCSTAAIDLVPVAGASPKRLIVKMLYKGDENGSLTYQGGNFAISPASRVVSTGSCANVSRTLQVTYPNQGSGQDFGFGLFMPGGDLSL